VKPLVPAQEPSVEAFLVADAAAEVLVEVALAEDAGFADETAPLPEHVPKALLQVEPQWSVVLPHQPGRVSDRWKQVQGLRDLP